jgi:putative membrane protein
MFWWWGPGGAWWVELINLFVLAGIVIAAVLLLRNELPDLQHRFGEPPALRLLEERYARGEISREEFLERRRVLLEAPMPGFAPMPGQATGPAGSDPTQPIPPRPPGS